MNKNVSKNLLSLAESDKKIQILSCKKEGIESKRLELQTQIDSLKLKLKNEEETLQIAKADLQAEEQNLQDEQDRIVERRKQLTTIGGAKAAKLVEREIEISARSLSSLEESSSQAMSKVDDFEQKVMVFKEEIEKYENALLENKDDQDTELSNIEKELKSLTPGRSRVFKKLDDRLQRLYSRVMNRYPDGAVAVAYEGACQRCFRFLPSQTYNQVLAGNALIQCPGSSRILVYTGEEVQKVAS